jgi:hypothetical protein
MVNRMQHRRLRGQRRAQAAGDEGGGEEVGENRLPASSITSLAAASALAKWLPGSTSWLT